MVLSPVRFAGALAAFGAPSLCSGAGKVPVVACFDERIICLRGEIVKGAKGDNRSRHSAK